MKLLNPTPFVFGCTAWRFDARQDSMVAIVKGTFDLRRGERAQWAKKPRFIEGDVFTGPPHAVELDELGSLRYASDAVPFKPKADALLVGKVHVPTSHDGTRRPREACSASFSVGSASLVIEAHGDRYWLELESSAMSAAVPFTEMEVDYGRAFGGRGFGPNPAGKGFESRRGDEAGDRPLPNLEDPNSRITSPNATPAPAGFGPLAAHWSYRISRWPEFDPRWLEERWPWAPAELDYSYFNAAQPALQLEGYLKKDKTLRCENLHREHRRYEATLPHVRPRCFVVDEPQVERGSRSPTTERFREVALRLDTLWVDMETEQLVLVWRGNVPVASDEFDDVRCVYLAAESLEERPLSAERHHEQFLLARSLAEAPAVDVEADSPPENDNDAPATARFEAPTEVEVAPPPSLPNSIRLLMERAGTPADIIERIAAGDVEGANRLMSERFNLEPRELDVMMAEANARLKVTLAEAGFDPGLLDPRPKPERPASPKSVDAPPWSRERVEACLASGESLAKVDLTGLDLSRLDFTGRDLSQVILAKADLSASWFDEAKLEGATLAEAKAHGARFIRTKLGDADLTRVDAVESDFTEAVLSRAVFDGASLASAKLDRCDASHASMSNCDLTAASLVGSRLASARLHGATLEDADLSGADLSSARAEGVKAARIDLSRANLTKLNASEASVLTGARLRGAQADGASFTKSDLTGADLTRASLQRADFSRCKLDDAALVEAVAKGALFDSSSLTCATLTRANLWGARLRKADLRSAKLHGACLHDADLFQARLVGAALDGAIVTGTVIGTPVQDIALRRD